MNLGRRMAQLLAALLLVLAAGLAIQTLATRDALRRELQQRGQVAARSLARQAGDAARMQALARALVDARVLQSVQHMRPDGSLLFEVAALSGPPDVPGWLARWPLFMEGIQAHAGVPHDDQPQGRVRVEPHTAWAYELLWAQLRISAGWLAGLALLAAALWAWLMRNGLRPLQQTLAQAQALEQGRYVELAESGAPVVRQLTRSMNAAARRLREGFAAQAGQVQALQRQALLDGLTALPLRGQFTSRLQTQLAGAGGPGVALILMRVLELEALNQRLGHPATDRLLIGAAGLMQAYLDAVPGTFAGRLNGADFALCLPASGLAAETAGSLHAALAAAPALHAGAARIVVGAVDSRPAMDAGAVLAAADAALAQAEAEGGLAIHDAGQAPADLAGSRAWREQIDAALSEGRIRIAECALRARDGQLTHLDCELRVQLRPGGEYEGAARWLALARRSQLLPRVDLATLDLALAATAADGQRRALQMAPASLLTPGFIGDVTALLRDAPAAARLLAIEWVGGQPLAQPNPLLAQAAQAWRACGVQLGVDLAGAQVQHITRASELGIHHIRLATRHLHGAVDEDAVRSYVAGLVSLAHGLGLQVLAQGVDRQDELAMLWELGCDGAAGEVVPRGEPVKGPETGSCTRFPTGSRAGDRP